jgi:hypothetical protein
MSDPPRPRKVAPLPTFAWLLMGVMLAGLFALVLALLHPA